MTTTLEIEFVGDDLGANERAISAIMRDGRHWAGVAKVSGRALEPSSENGTRYAGSMIEIVTLALEAAGVVTGVATLIWEIVKASRTKGTLKIKMSNEDGKHIDVEIPINSVVSPEEFAKYIAPLKELDTK